MPAYYRPPRRGRDVHNDTLFSLLRPAWTLLYRNRPTFVRALAAELGVDASLLRSRVGNLERGMCRVRSSELRAMSRLLGINVGLLQTACSYYDDEPSDADNAANPHTRSA